MLRVPLGVTTSRVFGFLETHRVLPLSLRADRADRTDRADHTDRRAASPCPAPHTLKSRLALGQWAELSSAGISRTFSAGDKEQGCWRPGGAEPRAGGVPAAGRSQDEGRRDALCAGGPSKCAEVCVSTLASGKHPTRLRGAPPCRSEARPGGRAKPRFLGQQPDSAAGGHPEAVCSPLASRGASPVTSEAEAGQVGGRPPPGGPGPQLLPRVARESLKFY